MAYSVRTNQTLGKLSEDLNRGTSSRKKASKSSTQIADTKVYLALKSTDSLFERGKKLLKTCEATFRKTHPNSGIYAVMQRDYLVTEADVV
jgi:hypothetical protein